MIERNHHHEHEIFSCVVASYAFAVTVKVNSDRVKLIPNSFELSCIEIGHLEYGF